jgi:hypothetical protein
MEISTYLFRAIWYRLHFLAWKQPSAFLGKGRGNDGITIMDEMEREESSI